MLQQVYLALGSNLGNRAENLTLAIKEIGARIGTVVSCSGFFRTAPYGFESDNWFMNAAIEVRSSLLPIELLEQSQAIERSMGRKVRRDRMQPYTDRVIDIDFLFYGSTILQSEELTLPHPHLHERSFVLSPLNDIAREFVHPLLALTVGELYDVLLAKE